jgi:DNA segregation ATPase FtsK/SpoIIIE-like protein
MFRTKKRKQSSPMARGASRNRWYDLMILMSVLCLFVLTISLLTFTPTDSSWCYYTNGDGVTQNWCGTAGAHGASLLFYLWGNAAYAVLTFFLFTVYVVVIRKRLEDEWERIGAFFAATCVLAALSHAHRVILFNASNAGGIIGTKLFRLCHTMFDTVGAFVVLYALFGACLIIVTRLSFLSVLSWMYHKIVSLITYLARYRLVQRSIFFVYGILATGIRALGTLCYWWYRSMESLYDGSLFQEAGYLTPEDDCAFDTMLQDMPLMPHEAAVPEKARDESALVSARQFTHQPQQPFEHVHTAHGDGAVEPLLEQLVDQSVESRPASYRLPQSSIFVGVKEDADDMHIRSELEQQARILEEKLKRFGVSGSVMSIKRGPVVTLFEYQPTIDTKLSKIVALEDDLALALQALSIRILAPIPGRSVVGFEVANKKRIDVHLSSIINDSVYHDSSAFLPLVLGHDTIGSNIIIDLVKMPHLLIAGSTGSGKSIALNTMLMSLLCKRTPDEMRLILIDPKRLEFASYADIAHLLFPIVTDPKKASPVLRWVVNQMEERYEKMAALGVRNIADYNKGVNSEQKLPFIVVIIDELADLMMTAGRDIEDLIARITQMARAAGIHMIVATQRPSVDVITGLIKVNFPSRISFRVTSKVDSRTILDCNGADKLLGRGDMLLLDSHTSSLRRVHGAYVSDAEITQVVEHIKRQQPVAYLDSTQELVLDADGDNADALIADVMDFLQEIDEVSISLLQRRFKIGYNRSARIIELLEMRGMIMPSQGGKTRTVIR